LREVVAEVKCEIYGAKLHDQGTVLEGFASLQMGRKQIAEL
jgi:hypothetical protein